VEDASKVKNSTLDNVEKI